MNTNVFSINQDSGIMTLKNTIDEEEYRRFIVKVEAKDLGSPQPLSSVVPVYVTVEDVNDNQPIFDKQSYRYRFLLPGLKGWRYRCVLWDFTCFGRLNHCIFVASCRCLSDFVSNLI